MKSELKISGVGALQKRFADTQRKATSSSVVVGNTANYALPVHELHATKSKFLENAARSQMPQVTKNVGIVLAKGGTLLQGLLLGGLLIQRESQKNTPVDTGNLKASAFTRKE